MKQARWIAVLAMATGLWGCANTKISDSWTDTTLEPRPLGKIVVVGLTDDSVLKRVFEDTFSAALRARGNDAVASYTFLKAGPDTNPDSLVAALRTAGYAAALTARSAGEETLETKTLGSTYYMPQAYYDWGSYYSMSYGAMITTTYNERTGLALIESNLYDLGSERLVWAARSRTEKTAKLKESVRDFTGVIVPRLAETGWIK